MTKVFIDGSAGTTGLRIYERLADRKDLELLILSDEKRKDENARKEALFAADIAFLCLPDAAAVEAVQLAEGSDTVIIDTSTAHRTLEGWTYGFAELEKGSQRELIRSAKRIANPGCHASGFIALAEPLVKSGLLKKDAALSCFSLTGYSGGGKKMIAEYEAPDRDPLLDAPRQYGLTQMHKHLKEMKKISGLETAPAFCPIVADFYSGMEVTVPVFAGDLNGSIEDVRELYRSCYHSSIVHYEENADDGGFLSAAKMSGRDDMVITVSGNEERILLVSLFDNLGKGASGSAIQCMNIVMGADETTGLSL
ncbi:MAG: N-acetyl-gamma-glutamyl-phosphate reductase [Lachnospiraceae bacterium]|nr:N-acetyl-gamma-glutamyl-phosphate reductase [Lachnospiraceae bacterium]